jgi:sugar/nucleoside kinase (ribokinase family)
MSLVEAASVYAYGLGQKVILDCGGQDEPISEVILSHLTFISPNETEILRIDPDIRISKHCDLPAIAHEIRLKLLSKFPNLKVLLKLGSQGSALVSAEEAVRGESVSLVNPKVL